MLYFLLISLAAVYGIASASKRCCIADQFHCVFLQISTSLKNGSKIPVTTEERLLLDFDYGAQIDRVSGNALDAITGNIHNFTIYNDYKNKRTFTLTNNTCALTHNDGMMTSPCIPENFQYEGTYTVGSGVNSVNVTVWNGLYRNALRMIISVTEDQCLPVTQNYYGEDASGRLLRSQVFGDVVENSLSDPHALELPASCKALIH